jgi:hypothetical protein
MAIARRSFLKNIFAGGALLAGATPVCSAAVQSCKRFGGTSAMPAIIIRANTSLDDAFTEGLATAGGVTGSSPISTVMLDPSARTDPIVMQGIFADLKKSRLLGIMENGPFTIFQALARTHGASFLCVGQHSWGGDKDYDSRHHWLTVPQTRGVGSIMAVALAGGTQGYFISEASLGPARSVGGGIDPSLPTSTDHWAAVAGGLLAIVGNGNWQPVRAGKFQVKRHQKKYTDRGSLVSFVVEI